MIELRTLGTVDLAADSGETDTAAVRSRPKTLALLIRLAVASREGPVRRDTLLALFWPELPEDRARRALSQTLYTLRSALGGNVIVATGSDDLRVAGEELVCDACDFLDALDEGRREGALELYGGDFLPGFHLSGCPAFDRWLEERREEMRRTAVRAALELAEGAAGGGRPTDATRWVRWALTHALHDEGVLQRGMRLLDRVGNRSAALKAYEGFAERLRAELELEPSPETEALVDEVRRREERKVTSGEARASPTRPAAAHASSDDEKGPGTRRWAGPHPRPLPARGGATFLALAFLALALGTAGYVGSRELGVGPFATPLSSGALDEKDPIVLADFRTRTVDSTLVYAVADAFRVDLSQSRAFRLADESHVADALRRMERDSAGPLDLAAARELAVREGLKAVIGPEIHAVGSGFTLSARVVSAEGGAELLAVRETAEDEDDLIGAVERLSRRLRRRIGESLTDVRGSAPLKQVRTSSLEALKRYTGAGRLYEAGDYERSMALAADALAFDSLFAAAYMLRGLSYLNMGVYPAEAMADLRRAYELRHRMTDQSRVLSAYIYHTEVARDFAKAAEVLEAHLAVHPGDHTRLNNLGQAYMRLGRHDLAEKALRRRLESPVPPVDMNWSNLTHYLLLQGKVAEAEEVLRRWEEAESEPRSWRYFYRGFDVAVRRGDYETAEAKMRQLRRQEAGRLRYRWATSDGLSTVVLARGRLSELEAVGADAMRTAEEWGSLAAYHWSAQSLASGLLWVGGDTARALSTLAEALARHPLESLHLLERDYAGYAQLYAQAGQPERAGTLLAALRDSLPPELEGAYDYDVSLARAWIAAVEGRHREAFHELGRAEPFDRWNSTRSLPSVQFARAWFHDQDGAPDSALIHYERFLEAPLQSRRKARRLGPVLERLGQLHEERDHPEEAERYYRRFVELWKDCDPRLRPRVDAARKALARLGRTSVSAPTSEGNERAPGDHGRSVAAPQGSPT